MEQPRYVSEVARFREQQALQEEAAKRSLYEYAIVSSHDIIESRMESLPSLAGLFACHENCGGPPTGYERC
jgi:hypothetical protein